MRRVFQNLIANATKNTPLHLLVEKIIEENTNLRAEAGVKLERRHFDLWPPGRSDPNTRAGRARYF